MAYTNLGDLFKGICDAIRDKKGTTGTINHQDIPSEIAGIETGADVSGVTAAASDVKSDKYYVNSSGTLTKGTMPNASIEVVKSSTSGFENFIQVNCSSAGYSKAGVWKYINPTSLDSNLKAENIRMGKNIFGVTGTYKGALKAVYLTDVEITVWDLDAGFSALPLGEANGPDDILHFVSIAKESAASVDEVVSLTIDAVSKEGIGWNEISGGTGRYVLDPSDFSSGFVTAQLGVVPDTNSSTGYSAQLMLYFTTDIGLATDGDQFTICAVWGSTTY